MSLEAIKTQRHRVTTAVSLIVVLIWTVWLVLLGGLSSFYLVPVPMTAVVLIFGAYVWEPRESLLYLLLMSLLYGAVSITPSGLFWLSLLVVFLFLRLVSFRLSIRSPALVAGVVVLTSWGLDFVQWILLGRVLEYGSFSWSLLGTILLSGLAQGVLSILVSFHLLHYLDSR